MIYKEELLRNNYSFEQAELIQIKYQNKIKSLKKDDIGDIKSIKTVAGVDISFFYYGDKENGVACAVLWNLEKNEKVKHCFAQDLIKFPYKPGFLGFRECKLLFKAIAKLPNSPDLIMCDGHGKIHPRRFGEAVHLGFALNIPTIGIAKNPYIGYFNRNEIQKIKGNKAPVWAKDPENIDLYYLKIRFLIYFNQYREAIKLLNSLLDIFPENEKDILILKAAVYKRAQDIDAGLKIINKLIQRFPDDNDLLCYKAYWMQYLDNKEESIKIIKQIIKKEPNNGLYEDTYGEILMYFEEYEEAAKKFLKAIMIGEDDWYIYQTYIKLGICYKALKDYDLALKNFKKGRALAKKSKSDPEMRKKWFIIINLFLAEIEPS